MALPAIGPGLFNGRLAEVVKAHSDRANATSALLGDQVLIAGPGTQRFQFLSPGSQNTGVDAFSNRRSRQRAKALVKSAIDGPTYSQGRGAQSTRGRGRRGGLSNLQPEAGDLFQPNIPSPRGRGGRRGQDRNQSFRGTRCRGRGRTTR
jgi:hypothetical protein